MSKNINTNANIAQIILSDKHEIRLKKKPKKKSSNKKKEALEKVKSVLQQFDLAINAAKNANVSIPEALGKLPDNINQINSVKELNALALDLQNRVSQINALIQQGGSASRTRGLFREIAGPQQPGFIPIAQQIQPRIIPNQQFPQQPIQPLSPPQPITPQQPITPSQQEDDDAEKTLDELQKEILSKLSPEDKAKAEAEFEKERLERKKEFDEERSGDIRKPVDPSQPELTPITPPSDPDQPTSSDSDIVESKGLENPLTNQKFDIKAPRGWDSIYNQYKTLIKNLLADIVKIDDKTLNLPKEKNRDIMNQQKVILDEYDKWLNALNQNQKKFYDTSIPLQTIDNEMIRDLQISPVQLLTEIAKSQKLDVTITSGEASDAEKRESKTLSDNARNIMELLPRVQKGINRDLKTLGTDKKLAGDTDAQLKKYDDAINKLNNTKAMIEANFDVLDGTDKVGILSKYNATQDGIQQAIVRVSQAKRIYLNLERIDPIESIDFDDAPEVAKQMPLPKPKPKLTPAQEKAKKLQEELGKLPDPFAPIEPEGVGVPTDKLDIQNVDILIDYYRNPSVNFSGKQKNAYLQLFGQDKLSKIQLKKGRKLKLPIIKREIQNKYKQYPDDLFFTVESS